MMSQWDGLERRKHRDIEDAHESFKLDHQERCNNYFCDKEAELGLIIFQIKKFLEFMEKASPVIDYVNAEIDRRKESYEFYRALKQEVIKWGLIGILSVAATYLWTHLKHLVDFKSG